MIESVPKPAITIVSVSLISILFSPSVHIVGISKLYFLKLVSAAFKALLLMSVARHLIPF